jgi:tripeptide aminopeptidase
MHRTASIQIAAILAVAVLSTIVDAGAPNAAAALAWPAQQRAADLGSILLQTPAVRAAVDSARTDEMRTIEDQIRICEVEAPPFEEAKRAELYAGLLREAGLKSVRIDAEGNVIAERPGANPRPNVVVSAHLDTVFPRGTNVKVRRDGYVLRGPGIGDDCRGLADLLAVARALNKAGVSTPGTITFVATVGEEGLGDLRGVKHLFNETLKGRIDRFVSIDGDGLGVTHIAIGSARFRVTFKGPGGHSFGSFGTVNPIHAVGRAMARIADFQVPGSPRTTFNVGRIGGGTSINAIASEAWMEVDLRSGDTASLRSLEKQFRQAVNDAVAQENARWNSTALTVSIETVGTRPAGRLPSSAPIVQAAISVSKALNLPLSFAEGSTDANLPLSLGIPAVTIDAGGRGSGAHTENETYDATDAWKGTQRAILLTVALAQP